MGKETTSKTEKTTTWDERFFGGDHYITKISDGRDYVTGESHDAKESQEIASDKWDKKK